jgi:hypothetical protein
MHRVEYLHTVSERRMTLYSQYAEPVSGATQSIGIAIEQSGFVDIYFTAHLNASLGGDGLTNDAYLFGARIAKAAPHFCTAKQGLYDQGGSYDFKLYAPGVDVPANNGYFNANAPYFVTDGVGAYDSYPAASDIVSGNLPSATDVSAVSVSFASTDDPDF